MTMPHDLLLVDDDPEDREIFLLALGRLGQKDLVCHTAADGPEALRKLKEGVIKPGLIFLDLNMPMMTGHQVLQSLKEAESTKHIPVVVLSTASDEQTIAEVRQLGAYNYYSKPVRMADWNSMLRAVLSSVGMAA